MFSKRVNDTSRVVRMTTVGGATTWSVILMTPEVSLMIIILVILCLLIKY
jgi:hypothetical protein